MLNCPSCEYADFEKDKCKRLLIHLPHVCPYAAERKPRNHFEQIKSMSPEELANYFDEVLLKAPFCEPEKVCTDEDSCVPCLLNWLKEEVSE